MDHLKVALSYPVFSASLSSSVFTLATVNIRFLAPYQPHAFAFPCRWLPLP